MILIHVFRKETLKIRYRKVKAKLSDFLQKGSLKLKVGIPLRAVLSNKGVMISGIPLIGRELEPRGKAMRIPQDGSVTLVNSDNEEDKRFNVLA